MAAGAWTTYNATKKELGNTALNLAAGNFRCSLYTSASNAATATLIAVGSVTSEVTEANGYSSSGKALTTRQWTQGTSAGQYKFDTDDVFWSANGGSIANIKFAIIWASGASAGSRYLVVRSQLSTAQFSLASGNRMTITMATTGILTLA